MKLRGNCSTRDIEDLLRHNISLLGDLEESADTGVLLLY